MPAQLNECEYHDLYQLKIWIFPDWLELFG